ncbi:MAG: lysophospholipid acyltransferase family protein [Verrucomicrobiota bacterium]
MLQALPLPNKLMSSPESKSKNWSGTGQLRGGKNGIAFFTTMIRFCGPEIAYLFAILPAFYFSFTSPDVPATMDFHRRMFGKVPWWKRRWYVFKHFYSFGRAIIDRTAILAGDAKKFSFTFDGEQHIHDAVAAGKGVLLLTAHVGNWEAAGQLLSRVKCPINVTGFDKEIPAIRAVLDRSAKQHFKLIPLTGSPTDAIQLVAAMRRGELVCMMGDRTYGSPAQKIPFLGGEAPFPIGGYVMAAIAGAPIVTVFSLREPGGHYHFFGFPPVQPHRPAHHERDAHLRACATQFAERLESIVKRDPFQWYNFFPFWEAQPRPKSEFEGQIPETTAPPIAPHPAP